MIKSKTLTVIAVGTLLFNPITLSAVAQAASNTTAAEQTVLIEPCRLVDTRESGRKFRDERVSHKINGNCGIFEPGDNIVGVKINLTATEADYWGWLTAGPRPVPAGVQSTSIVNFEPGHHNSNTADVMLSPEGELFIESNGAPVHYIVDVFGYYTGKG